MNVWEQIDALKKKHEDDFKATVTEIAKVVNQASSETLRIIDGGRWQVRVRKGKRNACLRGHTSQSLLEQVRKWAS